MHSIFDLTDNVALITGGGGLLGPKHAEAILDFGGTVILADHHVDKAKEKAEYLNQKYGAGSAKGIYMDVTSPESVLKAIEKIDKIDILINNAAKDPKVKKDCGLTIETRFENMTPDFWREGIDAALNGTFFCSQAISKIMIKNGKGVILNISSDLGIIAPDQRIYKKEGLLEDEQNVKPITYSAAKWAVIGCLLYTSPSPRD